MQHRDKRDDLDIDRAEIGIYTYGVRTTAIPAGPQCDWRLGGETIQVRRRHERTDSELIRKWAHRGMASPIVL